MFVVGLTGGIGSGKSRIATHFARLGAKVIDTDHIAHTLTAAQGAAIPALQEAFGANILQTDGALDRARLRKIIFTDPQAKKRLEAVLHPLILAESERQMAGPHPTPPPYILWVVPLLIETPAARQRCNRILVIDCSENTQITRTTTRSGLSAAEVEAIMRHQTSRTARLAAADDCIDNEGDFTACLPEINRLHQNYCRAASQYPAKP